VIGPIAFDVTTPFASTGPFAESDVCHVTPLVAIALLPSENRAVAVHLAVSNLKEMLDGLHVTVRDEIDIVDVTTTVTSTDAAPTPHAFRARTRTKYVPGTTPVAVNDVAAPTSTLARLARPGALPASRMYDVGAPDAAVQLRPTVPPEFCVMLNPVGAPGRTQPPPTTTTTSFEGNPAAPLASMARTRTKYVPAGTPVVENVVSALPVGRLARLADPLLDPASMRYETAPAVAVHVSVTVVPMTVLVRLVGAPNARAPMRR